MRSDMFKVLVERPRHWKSGDDEAARRRRDFDGPSRLGMRAGYGYRALNENLRPLQRYLHAQVGRPWAKVFSEICAQIDRRSTVQQHIHQHIDDFIATDVEWRDGVLVDLKERGWSFRRSCGPRQRLYVDPKSGLVRVNKSYRTRAQFKRDQLEKAARAAALRRVIDESSMLLQLNGLWFLVHVARLPERKYRTARTNGAVVDTPYADACHDVVLKRGTSVMSVDDNRERERLYGCGTLYAVSKRQVSNREMARFGVK